MPSKKKFDKLTKISAKSKIKSPALAPSNVQRKARKPGKTVTITKDAPSDSDKLLPLNSLTSIVSDAQYLTRQTVQPQIELKTDLQVAIDEIESEESSSELEQLQDDSDVSQPALNLFSLEDNKFLDFDINSIELSLSGEEVDSDQQEKLVSEMDFLEAFGGLPAVDEVSLDMTDELTEEKPIHPEKKIILTTDSKGMTDTGKFYDPVSGMPTLDLIPSITSLAEDSPTPEESQKEESDQEEEEQQQHRLSLTDDISKDVSEESVDKFEIPRPSAAFMDDTFHIFLESVKQKDSEINAEISEDNEALMREQEKLGNGKAVNDLLNNLIGYCVTTAEHSESETLLKKSLDKNRLITELKNKYDLLEFQKARSTFLNLKSVNFLRRRGSFRLITPESPQALEMYRRKFFDSLAVLDKSLIKEDTAKAFYSAHISDLRKQFADMRHQSMENIHKLEDSMRRVCQRKNFPRLQASVEKYLRKMSVMRNEISQVRCKLLLEQHEFSLLKKQLEKLQDLGNGLSLQQYESLQTETFAVGKKIEDQNTSLGKLHEHFYNDLHKTAHLKEKQKALKNIIFAQRQFLGEFLRKERELLKHVHHLKQQRIHLKQETGDLVHQAGLLTNAVLLRDYDKTVERANKLRQTNEVLRKTIEELNTRISRYG